ncbi:MAG: DnaJ domain-containing protein [Bacteroidota bacterium]|nr:DnaJ domain-containing protein [Bacteroidota bacterium]MDP4231793.1 DnaJ domain-containing protein [Bacteroidota bacterium]MDP4242679.1 DnaJ domain-containing protein [Bacteroidota bacterium]MDP4287130.1 DnaJ domain-containing protein [Bacteroidota bacterium]
MKPVIDYFAVLGLTSRASDREIREAYRKLAKLHHPDPNPDNPESALKMRVLNEAKSVLFDPVKREEHRVLLGLRDNLSAKRIEELRNNPRFQPVTQYTPKIERPRSPWDRKWKKYLNGIVAVLVLGTIGTLVYELLAVQPNPVEPIKDIIARYRRIEPMFIDTSKADTAAIPDDSADRLKRHGDILFSLGEYRSAAKYYEQYLRHVPDNDTVLRNLSFAYFRRGRYAESLEVLSKQMHGDSNLVVAYYNIGKMFLADEKPFDARDAFAEAVKIADTMRRSGRMPPDLARRARSELAKLE